MFDIGFRGFRILLTTVLVNKLFNRVDSVTHVTNTYMILRQIVESGKKYVYSTFFGASLDYLCGI